MNKIEKDTELYKLIEKEKIDVNSIHSMIATKELVEPYAKTSSYSEDGLVESFELTNKKFVMGIKWHLELLFNEKYVDRLFEKFINECWYMKNIELKNKIMIIKVKLK